MQQGGERRYRGRDQRDRKGREGVPLPHTDHHCEKLDHKRRRCRGRAAPAQPDRDRDDDERVDHRENSEKDRREPIVRMTGQRVGELDRTGNQETDALNTGNG